MKIFEVAGEGKLHGLTVMSLDAFVNKEDDVEESQVTEIDRRGFLKGLGAAAVAGGIAKKADAQEINKWVKYAKELLVNSPLNRIHQDTGYDLRNWVSNNVSNWVNDYCFKTNSHNAKEVIDYCHQQGIEASGLDKQNALVTAFLTNMKNRCQDYLEAYRSAINEKLKEFYNLQNKQPTVLSKEETKAISLVLFSYFFAKEDNNEQVIQMIKSVLTKSISTFNNKDSINDMYRNISNRISELRSADPDRIAKDKISWIKEAPRYVNELEQIIFRKTSKKDEFESVNHSVAESLNENASRLLSAEDRNGVITVVVQAPDGTKRSVADANPRYINQWLMKYGLTLPRSITSKFIESDMSGVMHAAQHYNKSFLITAELAEGSKKTFRVKAQSERVAREKFEQHHNQATIISVKEEGVTESLNETQFKSKEEAVKYAKERVKTFRDKEDGIEVWAMPNGSFDVNHTMNSNGRNHIVDAGGKKVGTITAGSLSEAPGDFGLGANYRAIPDDEMQDLMGRSKNKTKTKRDKYDYPYIHGSNIEVKDEAGKKFDTEKLRAAIMTRPERILGQNAKMQHSETGTEAIFDIGLPALKGLAVNEKTGEFVVVDTCPGAGACQTYCYAMKGSYVMFKAVSMGLARMLNFLLNDPAGFAAKLNQEIAAARAKYAKKGARIVVRWHDAGDFFSPEYLSMAYSVAEANPDVGFYAYTKMGDVANAPRPKNFNMNFSQGAKTGQEKKVNITRTKHSKVVPKDMFFDLIARKGNELIKDAKGRMQFASPENLEKFKTTMAQKYAIDKNSILTYDQMMKTPVGDEPKWNVIVMPGDGDNSANRNDVIGSYLLFH